MPLGSIDILFFIDHFTICDSVINGSNDSVVVEATTLSGLVAVGLMELEMKYFHLSLDFMCHINKW